MNGVFGTMRIWCFRGICVLAVALFSASCGVEDTYSDDVAGNEAMTSWHALATSGRTIVELAGETAPLVEQMAAGGEAGLIPLLEIIGAADEAPETKVLALIGLMPYAPSYPQMSVRALEITEVGNETTSRACATDLLRYFDVPEAHARLRALMSDSESRVRIAALIVLMQRSDPEALGLVDEMFMAADTNDKQKNDIAIMLPESVAGEHLALFTAVLKNQGVTYQARLRAIHVLGASEDASVLEVLEHSANNDSEDSIRAMAHAAIAAVKEGL